MLRCIEKAAVWRGLIVAMAMGPAAAAAWPLSSTALAPSGDWVSASLALETAERERAFPGLGLHAMLSEDWQAGVRVPFESATHATRWSDARRHGELLALRHFTIAPRVAGAAAAGATFNSGDVSQHPHFVTGSLVGVRVTHTATEWRSAIGTTLQQIEPLRDGSQAGDIWSLQLLSGRFVTGYGGRWLTGAALDGELYLPGIDAAGAETSRGHVWFAGARVVLERRRWRVSGAVQTVLDESLAPEDSAGHRLQLQLSYGLGR